MADPAILIARREAADAQIVAKATALSAKVPGMEPYPTDQILLAELIRYQAFYLDPHYAAAERAEWLSRTLDAIAEYVVEWDFQAEDLRTGEMVNIPPPSEVGSVVFEMLPAFEVRSILRWLRNPDAMRTAAKLAAQVAATQNEQSK